MLHFPLMAIDWTKISGMSTEGTVLYCMQMGSFFVIEGAAMNRDVGGSFHIPAASLSIFNTLAIIVLIPLYDSGFIPLLRRCGRKITLLQRIGELSHDPH